MRVSVLTMQNRAMLWCDLLLARVAVALRALVAPLGEALAVERVAAREDHHRRRLHRIARRPPRRAGGGGPRAEGGREYEQGDAQCRTAPSVGTLRNSLFVGRAGYDLRGSTACQCASEWRSGAVATAPARRTRAGRRLRWTCTAARCRAAEHTVSDRRRSTGGNTQPCRGATVLRRATWHAKSHAARNARRATRSTRGRVARCIRTRSAAAEDHARRRGKGTPVAVGASAVPTQMWQGWRSPSADVERACRRGSDCRVARLPWSACDSTPARQSL